MLAKAHIAKKALCLSDADYRHVLNHNFGVESSAALSDGQLNELLSLFKEKGWKPQPKGRPAESPRDRKPPVPLGRQGLMNKIEALLSELGRHQGRRVPWRYAEAILRKQSGDNLYLNWATPEQLEKVIQALHYAVKREKKKSEDRR